MKETRATAAVQPIAPVPGFMPGTRPMKLLIKMKKNNVAKNGKCWRQLEPTTPLAISSSTYSMTHSTPFTKKPLGAKDCFFTNAKITARSTTPAMSSQSEYWVRPTFKSPTTGVDENSATSSAIASGSLANASKIPPFSCRRVHPETLSYSAAMTRHATTTEPARKPPISPATNATRTP